MENGHRVQERLVVERDGVDVGHRDLEFGYESHGQARRSGGRVLGAHRVDTGLGLREREIRCRADGNLAVAAVPEQPLLAFQVSLDIRAQDVRRVASADLGEPGTLQHTDLARGVPCRDGPDGPRFDDGDVLSRTGEQ